MNDDIQEGQFEELETSNPPVNSNIFSQNNINQETKEKLNLMDKIADYTGIILGLLFMTSGAALALAFFFTFIPGIKFTFLHFLKCWAGVISGLLIRGILKTNT